MKQDPRDTSRLHMDRKMISILSIFAVLGICLVFSILIATQTLSALRGFASLQTHWTEVRKEASMMLVSYLHTGNEFYYARFDSARKVLQDAEQIREELFRKYSDDKAIKSNLQKLHIPDKDIGSMITAFKRFHDFPDFREAIRQWTNSDRLMQKMNQLALSGKQQLMNKGMNAATAEKALPAVFALDKELTMVQYRLAAALSSGTALLNEVILWISSSLGLILLLTGGFLSFRFLKSLKKWRRTIEISEQKYRSLFDHNPNAVYSVSKDGHLLQGNRALEKMTGYSAEELKNNQFGNFLKSPEQETVKKHFRRTLEGVPQTFEIAGTKQNGTQIHTEVTNLPIYIEGQIQGVYGIVQNITKRKEHEKKIREQLEEKTHLLSEIHDRVKNNLALISSLVQLQRDTLQKEMDKACLDSTIARIHSIAMVHERLYQNDTFSSIRIDEIIQELSDSVDISLPKGRINADTEPIVLGIKQAVPVALLLNELLASACGYGPERRKGGQVNITLHKKNGCAFLEVLDHGGGLTKECKMENQKTLGLQLIHALVQQLQGSLEIKEEGKIRTTVEFPVQT